MIIYIFWWIISRSIYMLITPFRQPSAHMVLVAPIIGEIAMLIVLMMLVVICYMSILKEFEDLILFRRQMREKK